VGIEPPKWHDVGPILIQFSSRFPNWFEREIPQLAAISRWLRREREPAMYGDEELGLPPNKLYTEPYARKAFDSAVYVYEMVRKLFKSFLEVRGN